MKHILIVGAGFGGLQTYVSLRKKLKKSRSVAITIINRHNYFLYTPMLHEVVFGAVERNHIIHPIREFTSQFHDHFFEDEVVQILPPENKVLTRNGKDISYDYLVIALGCAQAYFDIPGALRYSYPLKTLAQGIILRNKIIETFEAYENNHEIYFVIVGGGATGVEVAGQLSELVTKTVSKLFPHIDRGKIHITLIHAGERLVGHLAPKASWLLLRKLSEMKIKVLLGKKVKEIKENSVLLDDGTFLPSSVTMLTTGIASDAPTFILPEFLNERGFIKITKNLLVEETSNVFALGDIAECSENSFVKTAQVATNEGRHVAKNILKSIQGKKLSMFQYYHKGDLIPLGDWFGVAQFGNIVFGGKLAWWLRRTVFLFNLYQTRDILKIIIDWTIDIFSPRDTSKIE